MGKGLKREEASLFPLPIVPRGLFIFRCIAILLGYSVEVSAEERENGLYRCANIYVFFNYYFDRLLITTGYEIKVHKR